MSTNPFYPWVSLNTNASRSISKALQCGQIVDQDAALIREYISEYQASKHVKDHRALKTTYDLVNWRRFIKKPYTECTAQDIFLGVTAMKNGESLNGTPFKQNTQHDYVKALKGFLKWMIENEYSVISVDKINKIKIPSRDMDTITPDKILTETEIIAIIEAGKTARDRAMLSLLYETGCRVGEVARLRWKNLEIDKYGIGVYIEDTKTNKRRYSRAVNAKQYVAAWRALNQKAAPDDFVFYSNRKEPMEYQNMAKIIKEAAKRAGIEKRVHPHLFRKSRLTHMVQKGMAESVIKKMAWGNLDTKMFRTYVALSERDIDNEILKHHGLVIDEETEKQNILVSRVCPRCGEINPPQAIHCMICMEPLTEEAIAELDDMQGDIWKHRKLIRKYLDHLDEIEAKMRAGDSESIFRENPP